MLFSLLYMIEVLAASVDCPDVINFALGLKLDQTNPGLMAQLRSDCCIQYGGLSFIVCDTNIRVVTINFGSLNLAGVFMESYLPPMLQLLNLNANMVTGPLPLNIPSTMKTLFLDGNKFSGTIRTNFPMGITDVTIASNMLTGSLPVFPSSLTRLWVYGNQLSGDITGLSSNLKSIMLGYPGTTANRFTGTLTITQPTKFYTTNTWITDVNISNTSQIVACDLSNSPLLGNPHIIGLTMCTKSGLYSASALPVTISTSKSTLSKSTTTITNPPSSTTFSLSNSSKWTIPITNPLSSTSFSLSIDLISNTQFITTHNTLSTITPTSQGIMPTLSEFVTMFKPISWQATSLQTVNIFKICVRFLLNGVFLTDMIYRLIQRRNHKSKAHLGITRHLSDF